MTQDTEDEDTGPKGVLPSDQEAERRSAVLTPERLNSVEAVLADGELTPPQKLDLLSDWDKQHDKARAEGYGRVAGAADLGFPDPAPYSPEVQTAIMELYRRHRDALPEAGAWAEKAP